MKIGAVLLTTIVMVVGWRTLAGAGYFKTLEYHQEADCRPILGVWSSEDITIDERSGLAYVSATDRRPRPDNESPGAIFTFDLSQAGAEVSELEVDLDFEFRPHGISLLRRGDQTLLFAVNHRGERDSVEIFEVATSSLRHLETVMDERLFNLNDVVAFSPREFYVTRDHGGLSRFAQQVEDVLALPLSSVLYVNNGRVREAASDISYANGIQRSRDGATLYVAGTRDRSIHVFDRDPVTGRLDRLQSIDADTGVDNIEVDVDGALWVGAHPKILDFVDYASDSEALSPSQVLRIRFDLSGEPVVEEIMLTDGRFLSGSSVAARWGQYLLVGSVYDRRFLVCEGLP